MAQDKKKFVLQWLEPKCPVRDYRKFLSWSIIKDIDTLHKAWKDAPKFAFDTETTGLNPQSSRLAGYSFSTDGKHGYYVPIAHQNDDNAPRECLDYAAERVRTGREVLMFNKKFDLNIMEISEGYNLGQCRNIFDVQILVWLRDPDVKMPSLKDSSEYFLGIIQPKFEEITSGQTFNLIKSVDVVEYAGLDSICTFLLKEDTITRWPELKDIFLIDNFAAEMVRRMEHNPAAMSLQFLCDEELRAVERIRGMKQDVYRMVGYEFNLDSKPQVAEALMSYGVSLSAKTDGGRFKADIKTLEKIDSPLAKIMVRYAKEVKYYGSYVRTLIEYVRNKRPIRYNFFVTKVPTGRLASGQDKKNDYYAKINVQSIPKPSQVERRVGVDPLSVTGWSLKDSYKSDFYYVETGGDEHSLRSAFTPLDQESVWVSIDYKGQELRIAANLSGEKVWIDAFLNKRDVHWDTTVSIFGEKADKNKRKKTKITNFAALYGANEYTLSKSMESSVLEAKEFLQQYERSLPDLYRWKGFIQRRATKQDMTTFFGRPRRMSRYFDSKADRRTRAFGYRTAVNTVVQGAGADILKLAFCRILDWRLKNPEEAQNFDLLLTVHDEIDFSVKKSWLHRFMEVIPKLMTMKFQEWPVPIEVEVAIGNNWGEIIPYEYNHETKIFTPVGKYVKEELDDVKGAVTEVPELVLEAEEDDDSDELSDPFAV